MKEFDFNEFYENIQKDFLDANRIISDMEPKLWVNWHNQSNINKDFFDEDLELNKIRLVESLELIKLKFEYI